MSKFIINGNRALSGTVEVSGSKNAALPLIFATIITHGVSLIRQVPDISDVDVAIGLISSLGAKVNRIQGDLLIDTTDLCYTRPAEYLVSKIRASSYLLGANLARFGICHVQSFGGCNFDNRPIDMHINAMKTLGAVEKGDAFVSKRLIGSDIVFDKISVGATVNALLLTCTAKGKSRIFGYAKEPHVIALVDFLRSGGACITLYDDRIEVEGRELSGMSASVIPDMIEAGTYTAMSLLGNCDIKVSGILPNHLASFFEILKANGAFVSFDGNSAKVSGELCNFTNIVTGPYPEFPTDLQPQMAPLLSSFCGGRITEKVWKGRFGYLSELEKFGVNYEICDSSAIIFPSKLHSATAKAPDLRGGAAILMCALFSKGESIVNSAEIIKRGYSDILNKLRLLGADIEEVV